MKICNTYNALVSILCDTAEVMFNRLLGFHNPTPPNGAGLRHVANEVRCASKNVVPLLDIFDAPFERTFRISFRELLRWLPTIPVPIHVVHNSWPRDLQSRLPLRQFRRLALSHYTVFHVQCGVEHDALAVMAQPYLHEIEGYGSFDAALVTYAFEELQDVIKVAQSAEPTFVSLSMMRWR
ncbi:Hypothetical protein, putative [Bodo saltans]|uniref:Uncharacterized protein n=1 Tax=Bodo saltans TaxID=75058 RepID=A0A0S4JWB0_BODSA|nr:Hypothetical protein, putative [Bodo saltans]|eukprot:CUG93743.1 Hypothetical protein, putative [Bodo saltans]